MALAKICRFANFIQWQAEYTLASPFIGMSSDEYSVLATAADR